MSKMKIAYYNNEWEDPKVYPKLADWITKGKDNTSFCCNCGSFKIGAMGVSAPNYYMKPNKNPTTKTKHERNLNAARTSHSISLSNSMTTSVKDKSVEEGTSNVLELQRPITPADKKYYYGKS